MTERAWKGPESGDITAWLIVQAGHFVGRRFWSSLAAAGLTPIQFGVLLELDRELDASNAQLARTVLITPQAMSELLTIIEQEGLIDRDHSGGKGRRVPTRLTAAGRDKLHQCADIIDDVDNSLGLTTDEHRQLRALLASILSPRPPASNTQ